MCVSKCWCGYRGVCVNECWWGDCDVYASVNAGVDIVWCVCQQMLVWRLCCVVSSVCVGPCL